ncbi:MAG: hypothetical protein WCT36_01410 [Candidatus Gracilibacteria bacterium]|nr:MAG: hypothetical protein US89_C0004G0055 [Candidatus Peregrinibacteria bacterium GW2011_GWF2_38_29]KKR06963.1 MAG: hypothetical protein UT33_C0006G0039 [Candidatus Peregrinibacteria bacterium GW2011_GWC2_39_14]HBB02992.1 hypothetical protein [Candidatus Peregrinibacteria bacterium]
MINSSLDVLYLALALSAIIFTIFVSITLAYIIFILRDASKVISDVEELVDKVNGILISPLKFISGLMSYVSPFLESVGKKKKK